MMPFRSRFGPRRLLAATLFAIGVGWAAVQNPHAQDDQVCRLLPQDGASDVRASQFSAPAFAAVVKASCAATLPGGTDSNAEDRQVFREQGYWVDLMLTPNPESASGLLGNYESDNPDTQRLLQQVPDLGERAVELPAHTVSEVGHVYTRGYMLWFSRGCYSFIAGGQRAIGMTLPREQVIEYARRLDENLKGVPPCPGNTPGPSLDVGLACDTGQLATGTAECAASARNATGTVTYVWTVDGETRSEFGSTLTLNNLAIGSHEVTVLARDGTTRTSPVRTRIERTASGTIVNLPGGSGTGSSGGLAPIVFVGGALAAAAAIGAVIKKRQEAVRNAAAPPPLAGTLRPPATRPESLPILKPPTPPEQLPRVKLAVPPPTRLPESIERQQQEDQKKTDDPVLTVTLVLQPSLRTEGRTPEADADPLGERWLWGDTADLMFASYSVEVSPKQSWSVLQITKATLEGAGARCDLSAPDMSLPLGRRKDSLKRAADAVADSVGVLAITKIERFEPLKQLGAVERYRRTGNGTAVIQTTSWRDDDDSVELSLSVEVRVRSVTNPSDVRTCTLPVPLTRRFQIVGAKPWLEWLPSPAVGSCDGASVVRVDPYLDLFGENFAGGLGIVNDDRNNYLKIVATGRSRPVSLYFEAEPDVVKPAQRQGLRLRCKEFQKDAPELEELQDKGVQCGWAIAPSETGEALDGAPLDLGALVLRAHYRASADACRGGIYPREKGLARIGLRPAKEVILEVRDANPYYKYVEGHQRPRSFVDALQDVWIHHGGELFKREGATADGVSLLILRAIVAGRGSVRFSLETTANIGSLHETSSWGRSDFWKQQGGSALDAQTEQTQELEDGQWVAVVVYRPPADFDIPHLENNWREVIVTASFTPEDDDVRGGQVKKKFTLVRPPVVLVHGTYDAPKPCWNELTPGGPEGHNQTMLDYLTQRGFSVTLADYKDTSGEYDPSSFKTNLTMVWRAPNGIESALAAFRNDKKIAATRVDIVAHSMGGVLTRYYVHEADYTRDDNFFQGDVNRLITLCSTHRGSEVMGLFDAYDKYAAEGWGEDRIWIGFFTGWIHNFEQSIYTGAPRDQIPGSPELRAVGATPVRAHAIACVSSAADLETYDGLYRERCKKLWWGATAAAIDYGIGKILKNTLGGDRLRYLLRMQEEQYERYANALQTASEMDINVPLERQKTLRAERDRLKAEYDQMLVNNREEFREVVFGGPNDCTVSEVSARGGLTGRFTTTIPNVLHGMAPQYPEVQHLVAKLLESTGDAFFDPKGFPDTYANE